MIDELLGLEAKQVMFIRTVPGLNQLPFLGQVYRNRVDFAGDSGILPSVCARIVESQ